MGLRRGSIFEMRVHVCFVCCCLCLRGYILHFACLFTCFGVNDFQYNALVLLSREASIEHKENVS